MVARNWVGKLIPFKEVKRTVTIIKLRKCELIKFSKLPCKVGPVATPFCRQGNRGPEGKKLAHGLTPVYGRMVPAGGPSHHYSRGGAVWSLEHVYHIISSFPHSRADRSVLFFLNYVLFLLDSSLFVSAALITSRYVRGTPEAQFSFSLFCSPVLSLPSDSLPSSPVSAFPCLPVIWPVRIGGDSDPL